jgi:hypothetical protein
MHVRLAVSYALLTISVWTNKIPQIEPSNEFDYILSRHEWHRRLCGTGGKASHNGWTGIHDSGSMADMGNTPMD